jgi:predicted nucleic acid-binding protein
MTTYIIDAYAWVEYFEGSEMGERVKAIIENPKNVIITNTVTVAEITSFFERKGRDFDEAKDIMESFSSFSSVDYEFAQAAGKLHAKIKKERRHMGLADIFVLQTARKLKGKVVTGDEDFRGLKEVEMIK